MNARPAQGSSLGPNGAASLQWGSTPSLADVVDRILDKGVIINADITISVVGVELLGITLRAAIASFETAARYGLEFPSGTALPQWAGTAAPPQSPGTPDGRHQRGDWTNGAGEAAHNKGLDGVGARGA